MAARVTSRRTCTSSALGFSPIHRPLFQAPGYRAVCARTVGAAGMTYGLANGGRARSAAITGTDPTSAQDNHRAGCVRDDVLAHRAQQHACEAPVAA